MWLVIDNLRVFSTQSCEMSYFSSIILLLGFESEVDYLHLTFMVPGITQ